MIQDSPTAEEYTVVPAEKETPCGESKEEEIVQDRSRGGDFESIPGKRPSRVKSTCTQRDPSNARRQLAQHADL